jgi:uncharacterized membrane protein (UPF0127 family)
LVFFVLNKNSKNLTLEIMQPPQIVRQETNIKYVLVAGQKIKVDLAINQEEKNQGLSGCLSLDEGTGMLFIFEQPAKYAFWMKDMNFSIDIIWIAENFEITYIKKDAKPESFPESFTPIRDAKYILEVPAGFSDKYNLKEFDKVEFLF